MLLRWLIDQYVRDAAQGKVRAVVGQLSQQARERIAQGTLSATDETAETLPAATPRAERASGEFLPCDVAFIYALGVESGGLVDRLKGTETSRQPHGVEHAGRLGAKEVVIVESGVGQKAAARATAEAIKFYQPKCVISAGFAGGLDESLRRGHLVIADELCNLAGERIEIERKIARESLAGSKGIHAGALLTVDRILREPAKRRALAAAQCAIACDMETYAVARTCRERNVPLIAIRIISDAVDDELPPEIEHLLAQKSLAGKLGAAAGAVFKRLSAAKDLWKLREDALKASDRLGKFLVSVVEQVN